MRMPTVRAAIAVVVGLGVAAYAASSLRTRGGSVTIEEKVPADVMKFAESIPAKTAETLKALPGRTVSAVEAVPPVLPPIRRSIDRLQERVRPLLRTKATPEPATRPSALRSPRAVTLSPGRCSALLRDEGVLTLRVYEGMTLNDLALHFSTGVEEIRTANPAMRGDMLLAGSAYRVPVDHLRVLRHKMRAGDTMSQIGRDINAPSAYSIRTWNCLDSSLMMAGQQLMLFQPRMEPKRGASKRHLVRSERTVAPF